MASFSRADRTPGRPFGENGTGPVGHGCEAQPPRRKARLVPWQEQAAKRLLLEHFAKPVDIGVVARRCGISRGHFIAAFASSVGMAPYQWLIHMRVERASELLLGSDLALAEVALICGFYDQSHFSRAFVRWMGLSPGRWRELARSDRSGCRA
jgi:AraC-like DNA-binding protein